MRQEEGQQLIGQASKEVNDLYTSHDLERLRVSVNKLPDLTLPLLLYARGVDKRLKRPSIRQNRDLPPRAAKFDTYGDSAFVDREDKPVTANRDALAEC